METAAFGSQDKPCLFPLNDCIFGPENRPFSRSVSGVGSVGSSWSELSSPFGSELGSTETESEEDDYEFMDELTRKMADYMLQEDDDVGAVQECENKKFEVSSESQLPGKDYQAFNDEQIQEIHLHKTENQPAVENQIENCRGVAKGPEPTQPSVADSSHRPEQKKPRKGQNRAAGVLGAPPAVWPKLQPPQQNYGSGMRAVFLGGPGSRTRTTSGTGVFLPRGPSNPLAVQKKLGCSTVLIPTRVLHALQLHFQNVNNPSQSNDRVGLKSYRPQYDINPAQAMQRSPSQSHSTNKNIDIDLPQEWTY